MRIPDWIQNNLANPPEQGTGYHSWIFNIACQSIEAGNSEAETESLLMARTDVRNRSDGEREIREASAEAARKTSQIYFMNGGGKCAASLPPIKSEPIPVKNLPVDPEFQRVVLDDGHPFEIADLWHESPIIPEAHLTSRQVLESLFPDDPLVCVGEAFNVFLTAKLSEIPFEEKNYEFIVPNEMSAIKGERKDGKGMSYHALANTGQRKRIVIEFDDLPNKNHQSHIIWWLSKKYPHKLEAVIDSGGKSLHAWFSVENSSELESINFFNIATQLGADSINRNRSQFSRVPNAIRTKNNRRQALLYLNL